MHPKVFVNKTFFSVLSKSQSLWLGWLLVSSAQIDGVKQIAAYCARWDMRYEELLGTDHYLRRLVEIAIGLEQKGDEFLLISPASILTQAHFIR